MTAHPGAHWPGWNRNDSRRKAGGDEPPAAAPCIRCDAQRVSFTPQRMISVGQFGDRGREREVAELTSVAMRRLAGIGMSAITLWSCRGNADFSDAMPAPVTLTAEDYRREITEIDRLVFREGPFDDARRTALAGELEGLARRMKAASDSRFIAIEALEIRRLAEVAKRAPAKPPPGMLSDPWMRIRSNVFDDRSWFARSAADLETPAIAR